MIELRPYQIESVEGLRSGIRAGHRKQILCAPTGAGKTICGAYLLQEAQDKGRRAAFVVDRVALADQTSKVLWRYGIQHGMAQGQNTFGRDEFIQVCSAQTLEKRGMWPGLDLLIVDEAHTQRKQIIEFIKHTGIPVIGLTATPFSKGLGDIYSNVINVTTTYKLIEDGFLAPLRVYAAKEIDMTGAKVVAGEWSDREIEKRGKQIVGDIVSEWEDKTRRHFGGPVKTIAFSATVDHGEEMCRKFQSAGYDFRQISYKDRDDDHRKHLISEFRAGRIMGLVSCEALAKGFDVEDIMCLICARPYRKSFSSHIQMIGRAMRASPGKEYALLLDHAGNYVGFHDRMVEFFNNGCSQLDADGLDNVVRDDKVREKKDIVCSCGFVLSAGMERCPACGKERVRRSLVEAVPGEMFELGDTKKPVIKPYLESKKTAWLGICHEAARRKGGDTPEALRFARAQYHNFYHSWPNFAFEAGPCDSRLKSAIQANLIRYFKRKQKAA